MITYIGHSAFYITIKDKHMLFDPWIKGNPLAAFSFNDISKWPIDYIFVSHDHADHGLNEAIALSKQKNIPIITVFELANYIKQQGAKSIGANIGGPVYIDDIKVILTPALHSSSIGVPVGFIVDYNDTVLYHAGDTGYFCEMNSFKELYNIDVAFLPIGGTYTMGIKEAGKAGLAIAPKIVIPMHYNTFETIKADPGVLKSDLENKIRVDILRPGESIKLF